jgi:hypothetical protein
MSSKRAAARVWKRKRKQRQQMMWVGCILAAAALLIGITVYALDARSKSYVMLFEGQRIHTRDLQFVALHKWYSNGFTALPDLSEALDDLITFLVIDKDAREKGITLNEEEVSLANAYLDYFLDELTFYEIGRPRIPMRRMSELIQMQILFEKLMDYYMESYERDEMLFGVAFADYKEFHRVDYIDMQLKWIETTNIIQAREAWERLSTAEPSAFDDIIRSYMNIDHEDCDHEDGEECEYDEVPIVSLRNLNMSNEFDSAFIAEMSNRQAGEFSEPITLDDIYWYVFIVDSVEVPTDEEIEERYGEAFDYESKLVLMTDILADLKRNARIQLNEKGILAA